MTVDLSKWEGQTVRLRLASVDNRGPLRAGVDDIRLEPAANRAPATTLRRSQKHTSLRESAANWAELGLSMAMVVSSRFMAHAACEQPC